MKRLSLIIIHKKRLQEKIKTSHSLKNYLRFHITVYQAKLYIPGCYYWLFLNLDDVRKKIKFSSLQKWMPILGDKLCQLSNFPSHPKYLKTRSNIYTVLKDNDYSTRVICIAKLQFIQYRVEQTTGHVPNLIHHMSQQIKFFCSIATAISLLVIQSCFQITMTKVTAVKTVQSVKS